MAPILSDLLPQSLGRCRPPFARVRGRDGAGGGVRRRSAASDAVSGRAHPRGRNDSAHGCAPVRWARRHRLMSQLLSGPQELSITDDANDARGGSGRVSAASAPRSTGCAGRVRSGLAPMRPATRARRIRARCGVRRPAAPGRRRRDHGPTAWSDQCGTAPGTIEPLDAEHGRTPRGRRRGTRSAAGVRRRVAPMAVRPARGEAICGGLRQMLVRGATGQVAVGLCIA